MKKVCLSCLKFIEDDKFCLINMFDYYHHNCYNNLTNTKKNQIYMNNFYKNANQIKKNNYVDECIEPEPEIINKIFSNDSYMEDVD